MLAGLQARHIQAAGVRKAREGHRLWVGEGAGRPVVGRSGRDHKRLYMAVLHGPSDRPDQGEGGNRTGLGKRRAI